MALARALGAAAVALGLAAPALAQTVAEAGAPFVPNMVAAVSRSFEGNPFYGSMLINAFDFHLRQVAPLAPAQAAAYLKTEILGSGKAAVAVSRFNERLGQAPLEEHRAA